MEYVNLGSTNSKISRISFGCWEMGGAQWEFTSDEVNNKVIHTAWTMVLPALTPRKVTVMVIRRKFWAGPWRAGGTTVL
jgi:hypothetical protein